MKLTPVRLALLSCILLASHFSYHHRWHGDDEHGWEATIDGDAKGAYAFLPAFLIYKDPTFTFYKLPGNDSIARYYNDRFRVRTAEGTVNKNYAGVAIMLSPFFVAGHLFAKATDEPLTGYSWPYMLTVIVGSLFYYLAGLAFMAALLRSFHITEAAIALTVLLIGAGTNLLYYSAIHCAMPHVYSFFLVAAFCYFIRKYFIHPHGGALVAASILFGFILVVRPVNGLVLFIIPFLSQSAGDLWQTIYGLRNRLPAVATAFILLGVVILFQLSVLKYQSGHWWVWSYGDEGFRFNDPHIFNMLFSFRKGLFVYTPAMLLSFAGIYFLFKKSKWLGWSYGCFMAVLIYILASWWSWFYGDGFGLRAFIDFFPFMAIPAAMFTDFAIRTSIRKRIAFYLVFLFIIILSVIQTYQYRYRIIHPAEMSFIKYWHVFLETGEDYRDLVGGDNEYIFPRLSEKPVASWFNDFEAAHEYWPGTQLTTSANAFSGSKTAMCDQDHEFAATFSIRGHQLPLESSRLYAIVKYQRKQHTLNASKRGFLACSLHDSSGATKEWKGFRMNEYPLDDQEKWHDTEARFKLPENIKPTDELKLYIWNQEKKTFEIDNMSIEFYSIGE